MTRAPHLIAVLLALPLASPALLPYLVPPADLSFAALNASLSPQPWPFAPAQNATFVFTATCCGYGNFTPAAVAASSAHWGLWTIPCLPDAWPVLAEWGYEFMANQHDIFPLCGNLTLAQRGAPPASREQALAWLTEYFACRAAATRICVG